MIRTVPRSLLGQVMFVLALGLLVAQTITGVMLYRAAEQKREAALLHSVAIRLAMADQSLGRREWRARLASMGGQEGRQVGLEHMRHPRSLRIQFTEDQPLSRHEKRLPRIEQALRELLEDQEIQGGEIAITRRFAGDDSFVQDQPRLQARLGKSQWQERMILVAAIQRPDGKGWSVVRVPEPPPERSAAGSIIIQTLVLYLVLFTLLFLVIRRITRPLAQLTTRVDHFTQQPDRAIALEESGPEDVRKLIAAHNAMEARVASMLDEKDVMLGAIGHDLKTPLAALRVRIESVEDDGQRARMAQSIEDIAATLDDILSLARVGRPGTPPEMTDISALVAGVVEEFEDMDEPVELRGGKRVIAPVRPTWIRRAARNLISNALRYGKRALVEVEAGEDTTIIRIDDEGPGIPEGQIAAMMEPFQRGEASRNRSTGGAGLGLTLARAIAEQHGGTLELSNREQGGLRAELIFPAN